MLTNTAQLSTGLLSKFRRLTNNHFRAVVSTARVKRQLAEDSDYHYGPNHNAPHFIIGFNGDNDLDIDVEIPDFLDNTLGILGGIIPTLPFGKKK